MDGLLYCMLYA